VRAYVGLGANLGDRERTLRAAVEQLAGELGIEVISVSTLRETEPWGRADQPSYLNGAVELETALGQQALLDALLRVERSLGRVRSDERWGPRTIDLDLLVQGDAAVDEPGLTLPHPHLHERRFVLEPLVELAPTLVIPGRGRAADLLAALPEQPSRLTP
jgi:2-amino-4-hydroxy-6-hydroxymethyldihydropteridine diphosphokinase